MKWQYKVHRGWLAEHDLNALGAEGWELMYVLKSDRHIIGLEVYYYFKRPVNQQKSK
jgi:hypothetical protein